MGEGVKCSVACDLQDPVSHLRWQLGQLDANWEQELTARILCELKYTR